MKAPLPKALTKADLQSLGNPVNYKKRLRTFSDETILPQAFIEQYGRMLRSYILFLDTKLFQGTFGANGGEIIEGWDFYNERTSFYTFFDKDEDFSELDSY